MFNAGAKEPEASIWLAAATALVARKLGVYVARDALDATFGSDQGPKPFKTLREFFLDRGVVMKTIRLKADDFRQKDYLFPSVLPLKNGRAVVVLGLKTLGENEDEVTGLRVLDPLDAEGKEESLSFEDLEVLWLGQALVTSQKRNNSAKDRLFNTAWFTPELWRNRGLLMLAVVISLLLNALAFAPIIFVQIALDKVVGYRATTTLYVLTGGVALALAFNAILGYLRDYVFNFVGGRIEARIAGDLFDKILALPIHTVKEAGAGGIEHSVNGVVSLRSMLVSMMFQRLFDLTALIVFLPILFAYSPILALIVLGFALAMGLSSLFIKSFERKRSQILAEVEKERTAVLRESLSGIETVKALAQEDWQRQAWRRVSAAAIKVRGKRERMSSSANQMNIFLQQLMTVTLIFTGVHLVFSGDLSAGSLIAVNMVGSRLVGPINKALALLGEKERIKGQIDQIGSIWNAAPERLGAGSRQTLQGRYNFSKVGLRYGKAVGIRDVSLNIPARSRVAVVGPSGAGKSTLLKLMQGTYMPTSGSLDVDGVRITQFDLPHFRSQVSLLPAAPGFFNGTIEDNLRRACGNYGRRELDRAIELAGFDKYLPNLPDGLQTVIDETASQLPGGQRQKLALVRTLLADPKVVLLDEALNALGNRELYDMVQRLPQIAAGRTLVMISQELAVVKNFDQIVVLKDGLVAGAGSHDYLLKTCATYREMWRDEQRLMGVEEAPSTVQRSKSTLQSLAEATTAASRNRATSSAQAAAPASAPQQTATKPAAPVVGRSTPAKLEPQLMEAPDDTAEAPAATPAKAATAGTVGASRRQFRWGGRKR